MISQTTARLKKGATQLPFLFVIFDLLFATKNEFSGLLRSNQSEAQLNFVVDSFITQVLKNIS